jgi:hypothetical protein
MADDIVTPIPAATTFKGKEVAGIKYPGKILYDEAAAEVLGKVTASPGATTVLGRLKSVADALAGTLTIAAHAVTQSGTWTVGLSAAQTLATVTTVTTVAAVTAISNALPAGTNLLGKVKTKFIVAAGSAMTRPANQTPYAANDSISDNATAGSVTANSFNVSDVNDDTFTVERLRVDSSDTGIAGKAVRAWLYTSNPTSSSGVVGGDNAAFSNKKAGFVGTLSGTFRTFSDGSVAVLVPDEGARIVMAPTSGAKTLYWQLQALEAFTPSANSTTFTPTVEGFQGAA